MRNKLFATLVLALAPTIAFAESSPFSANVSLTSDYLYRGISQSGAKPAIQGGFDFAHSSGFYAGAWGSSISWLSDAGVASSAGLELDTYLGFKNNINSDLRYDVGFLRYNYPGTYVAGATKADTNELYAALTYKWITAKYSYSLGDTFGVKDARGSDYFDLSASYTFDGSGITLGAHYGKQKFKGPNAGTGNTSLTYSDYKVNVSKDFSGYVLGLAYSDTDAEKIPYTNPQNKYLGRGTFVLSVSRTF